MSARPVKFSGMVERTLRPDGTLSGGRGPRILNELVKSRLAHCPCASAGSGIAEDRSIYQGSSLSVRLSALRKTKMLFAAEGGQRFES